MYSECFKIFKALKATAEMPQKRNMSTALSTVLYENRENIPFHSAPKKITICASNSSSHSVNNDLETMSSHDLIASQLMSSPRFQQVLAELSETNIENNFCPGATLGRNLNISNVSGGVFNFYLNP